MAELNFVNLAKLARMWVVVLLANFSGTLIAAVFCSPLYVAGLIGPGADDKMDVKRGFPSTTSPMSEATSTCSVTGIHR